MIVFLSSILSLNEPPRSRHRHPDAELLPVLGCPDSPASSVLHRLTIGQKLLLFFGVLLALLALSMAGLLFYLSRVNSYVHRHQINTIPGVVTAAEIQQHVFRMHTLAHRLLDAQPSPERPAMLARLEALEARIRASTEVYRDAHAAGRHPTLRDMLTAHGRADLIEQEEAILTGLAAGLDRMTDLRRRLPAVSHGIPLSEGPSAMAAELERTTGDIERSIGALIEVHRRIDEEMKLEGDRLVGEAGIIVLVLAVVFGLLILGVFLAMKRLVARPLEGLASTADRVAHHDLTVQFEPWPSKDEVGRLADSLSAMLTNLRDRSTALVRKTKELEAFTYSVAHDLKGPLREIEGFSSLLEKRFADSADQEVRHHLDVIRRSSLRLTVMIDALLKYSRLEQQTLPMTRFNLAEMLAHLVAERQQRSTGEGPAVRVDMPFPDLYGEPVSVRQALQNLLDNAVKFSRLASPPLVVIGGRRTPGETLLWVRDNGIGIDAKDQERMFGLFERMHEPSDYEGTGVGLAIVKLVMDKHGGRVWVESTPGQGSTFYLAFPERHS